jgi:hypothetical protein
MSPQVGWILQEEVGSEMRKWIYRFEFAQGGLIWRAWKVKRRDWAASMVWRVAFIAVLSPSARRGELAVPLRLC